MGKDSEIEWCDHTFNPWWGCVRVSPGCEHCYAEAFAKRTGHPVWGVESPRRFFGEDHWAQPICWNAAAAREGRRERVFCASMADVFEARPGDVGLKLTNERSRLFALIEKTPHLDWLLLTKRPQNFPLMLPCAWLDAPRANVWLGTTVEDQRRADERIPLLLDTPAAVRFLSCEPLLEPVQIDDIYVSPGRFEGEGWNNLKPLAGIEWYPKDIRGVKGCTARHASKIHWVIVGGESGPGARPFALKWGEDLVAQCRAAGVPVFFKQAGRKPVSRDYVELKLRSRKGSDFDELPASLHFREFPTVRT